MTSKPVLLSQGAWSTAKKSRKSLEQTGVLNRYKQDKKTTVIVETIGISESAIHSNEVKIQASVKADQHWLYIQDHQLWKNGEIALNLARPSKQVLCSGKHEPYLS